jgi:hypothetical protein
MSLLFWLPFMFLDAPKENAEKCLTTNAEGEERNDNFYAGKISQRRHFFCFFTALNKRNNRMKSSLAMFSWSFNGSKKDL